MLLDQGTAHSPPAFQEGPCPQTGCRVLDAFRFCLPLPTSQQQQRPGPTYSSSTVGPSEKKAVPLSFQESRQAHEIPCEYAVLH